MVFIPLRINFYIFKNLHCLDFFGGKNLCTLEGIIIVQVLKEVPSEKHSQFSIMHEDGRIPFELQVIEKGKVFD